MFRYSEDILVLGHSRHLDRIAVEKPRDKTRETVCHATDYVNISESPVVF